MPDQIKTLHGTVPLQAVAEQSNSIAAAINALLAAEWVEGDDWDILWSDANVKLVHPPVGGDDGTAGLGVCVFAGTASGEVAYFKVACDGVAYPSPPAGIPIANPP